MDPRTLIASVLVLLVLQPGRSEHAGNCIADEDLVEATACCKEERFVPKDIAEKCYEQVRNQHHDGPENLLTCLLSCTYDAMGLITDTNEVDAEKLLPYFAAMDDSLRQVMTSAVQNCAKSADDIKRDIGDMVSSCNVFPIVFHMCVSQYTLDNCPAERFTTSAVCAQVKAGWPPC